MATFEDFLPEVKQRAYGVSDPTAELYIRSAAIEFCEDTRAWQRQIQEFAFAGDARIIITGIDEDEERLEAVIPGFYNGVHIGTAPPVQAGPILSRFADVDFSGIETGSPMYIFEVPGESNTVGVYPVPDKQYSDVMFTIALVPTETCTVLPDFLLQGYRRAIVEGALARIHELAGQPFTDPTRQATAEKRFAAFKLNAKIDALRGRTISGNLQVEMRPFAYGARTCRR